MGCTPTHSASNVNNRAFTEGFPWEVCQDGEAECVLPPPTIARLNISTMRRGFTVPSGCSSPSSRYSQNVLAVPFDSWNAVSRGENECVLTGSKSTAGNLVDAAYSSVPL
ncbi:hypothetical protein SCP_0100780 [Sparassis crispa]|uniref:Uncharacterized protein n=1 Tax=Sparassis crispa TaxID=139825 RepID=A0A401G4U7_9APHY|nr:hypothetical protein SCP_0100780 [Sparassis crispa]GBE77206.1 hypothetical protein SCP_0100780 [Sparassis crispa]